MDKPFYLSGEKINFKLYLPPTLQEEGILVQAFLFGESGQQIQEFYLQAKEKQHFVAHYPLPYDFPAGMYCLRFFANSLEMEAPVLLLEKYFPIFNGFDLDLTQTSVASSTQNDSRPPQSPFKFNFQLDSIQLNPRENIEVRLQVEDSEGNMLSGQASVTVRDHKLINTKTWPGISFANGEPLSESLEMSRNILLAADTENSNGTPLYTDFSGLYTTDFGRFIYPVKRIDNHFTFSISPFTGETEVQGIDLKTTDAKLVWEDYDYSSGLDSNLFYTPGILDYIRLQSERNKIYQLFQIVESSPELLSPEPEFFELETSYVFDLTNYEAFRDFPEFLQEVITPLKLRTENDGSYYARMFDPEMNVKRLFPGPTLFIVDGRLSWDANLVASLPWEELKTLTLYCYIDELRDNYGVLGYHGIAVIDSKTGTLGSELITPPNQLNLSGLLPEPESFIFQIEQDDLSPEIPMLRPQLYWNPELNTDESRTIQFSYLQSDDISQFEIEVIFQDETGRIGWGSFVYEVK